MLLFPLQAVNGEKTYNDAITLSHQLRAAYDQVLQQYDVLIMPTTRFVAPKLPDIKNISITGR